MAYGELAEVLLSLGRRVMPFSELALANKLKPLIGNRLIYPDGTVNSFVKRYLRDQVAKLFEARSRRPVQKR